MGGHIVPFPLHISGSSELKFQATWLSIQDDKSSPKNTNKEIAQLCVNWGQKKSWTYQELGVKKKKKSSESLSLFRKASSEDWQIKI